ncbi:MAG: 2-oxo acid dehydrogenase subunit E2 [Firmicutes bacterium]|nr:2-oxo acid dehydrogenase subunit E2 [Bacillota bacterium]
MQEKPNVRRVERFGLQRKIVANMTTESWREIPHTGVLYEPDVTAFWDWWQALRKTPQWQGISVNTVMLYACTLGLLAAPDMNAHIRYKHGTVSGEIKQFDTVNLSMPTTLPSGQMMTLNVHNCESKTLRQISDNVADLRRRLANTSIDDVLFDVGWDNTIKLLKKGRVDTIIGRLVGTKIGNGPINKLKGGEKKAYNALPPTERLTKHDIEQGTCLLSNIGSLYRGSYNPPTLLVVIPPMVCALCIGSFTEKPGIVTRADGTKSVEPRLFLPISITFDHRALDYGEIVPFLGRMDEVFAAPQAMAEWPDRTPAQL